LWSRGEKDVHTIELLGLVGTCNPMGAGPGKWLLEYSEVLRGKHVVILPDADEPGRKHAANVACQLANVAAEVRLLEMPGAKDIFDWVEAGGTVERLEEFVSQAQSLIKPPAGPKASSKPVVDAFEIYDMESDETAAVVDGLLFPGVTVLAGRQKLGKSWLTLQLAIAISHRAPFMGKFPVRAPGRVLYCALEEPPRRTASRLHMLLPERTVHLRSLKLVYGLKPLFAGGLAELDQYLLELPSALVVIDTFSAVLQASSNRDAFRNDYAEMTALRQLAEKHKTALVVVHHLRKAGAEYALDAVAGTTGVTAGCDAVWVLRRQFGGDFVLDVTGREMEEQSYALKLDNGAVTGWRVIGDGHEAGMSEERREILDLLREEAPLKPVKIARLLQKKDVAVRRLLQKMLADGVIHRNGDGSYCAARGNAGNVSSDRIESKSI
jgi:hypothetical protein